jgi:DNA-binding MarR family transcriptional regulator
MKSLNLTQPQFCACANLRQAARAITQFYDAQLQPSGLRATQFTVLMAISLNQQITITDLAARLGMDRTTLTRNLKPLEKQGLVESDPGEDRRTRVVTLTGQGKEALKKAWPLWEKTQQQVVEALGPEKFNQVLANVSEIVSVIHQN